MKVNEKQQTVDSTIISDRNFLILIVFMVLSVTSCLKGKRRSDTEKIVKEGKGEEIRFPEGLACTSIGIDTICMDLYGDSYKILLYVDSMGFTSCRLNCPDWKRIMNESDTVFIMKSEFVLVFQPKKRSEKELYCVLKSKGFRNIDVIDKENEFNNINKLLILSYAVGMFRCFITENIHALLLQQTCKFVCKK